MLFRVLTVLFLVVVVGGLAVALLWPEGEAEGRGPSPNAAIPVEVAPIATGRVEDLRTFSGTLVPRARFVVAAKVAGRIDSLAFDVGDAVENGETVAQLDDAELLQAVAEAEADLEVAKASVTLAKSNLEIAQSEFDRAVELEQSAIASGASLDVARSQLAAQGARLAVAEAEVVKAGAALAARRVQLSYTKVTATWVGGSDTRVVSERHVDEGATLAANDPIVTVVDSSVLRAELFVTERGYGRLRPGQAAKLRTDAWPDETFDGTVLRLAPVFEEASRQTRVEVLVPNDDDRLRPGMYVRVTVVLDVDDEAVSVPRAALVRREVEPTAGSGPSPGGTGPAASRSERFGVFVIDGPVADDSLATVTFRPVRPGIEFGDRVQLLPVGGDQALPRDGKVVVLGQQLLADGGEVRVVRGADAEPAAVPAAREDAEAPPTEAGN